MKGFIAWPVAALMFVSVQVSALCLNISESYTGVVPSDTEGTAFGPFTIAGDNGCLNANISAMVSAGGAGRAPEIYIQQAVGATWKIVAGNPLSANASWVGPFGTYRVVLRNPDAAPKSYSGTVRYGR
ncbi:MULTISPECIES: hypothetical protein [Pseudomonas]|uniref:Uncharacterized protein n=1 Tax=Pseudomonas poae TaxID=200451 RepID=A0AAP2S676_9PSED|nr:MULTISPECIES: hypothetical protein [Pseudomonas]MCF5658257.1 hypothetical protein [Pseudomonas poae]MCF5779577.1 hypothetical protein [Pseudomonas poae]NMZ51980.1 hypothetical protein [Pseudomonas poae]